MAKTEEKQPTPPTPPAAPEPTVVLQSSALAELIGAAVRAEVAKIMTAKGPDERIAEAMAVQRGQTLPQPIEAAVDCRSPITGAIFTVRLLQPRKPGYTPRVVELLDYERPEGWDRSIDDGGKVLQRGGGEDHERGRSWGTSGGEVRRDIR